MRHGCRAHEFWHIGLISTLIACLPLPAGQAWGESKAEKTFKAVITDTQGVDTEVQNIVFYWEERVSETAFVPHEIKQVPVKRGNATVHVRFDSIRQIDAKAGLDKGAPVFTITLVNGKVGEFHLAIAGSFRGESDFGQVDVPANAVTKVVFR